MLKMNEKKFFKTEFGAELDQCVKALDKTLELRAKAEHFSEEWKKEQKALDELFARLDVYKQGLRTFYGLNLCFTRTDEYFGLCTEDESYFLMKIDREEKKDNNKGERYGAHC